MSTILQTSHRDSPIIVIHSFPRCHFAARSNHPPEYRNKVPTRLGTENLAIRQHGEVSQYRADHDVKERM